MGSENRLFLMSKTKLIYETWSLVNENAFDDH